MSVTTARFASHPSPTLKPLDTESTQAKVVVSVERPRVLGLTISIDD